MTKAEKLQKAREFLTGAVAYFPERLRGDLTTAFESVKDEEAEALAEHVASSILRQEDYSRGMNELRDKETAATTLQQTLESRQSELNSWWETNSRVLKQAKQLMEQGKWPGDSPPANPDNPTPPAHSTKPAGITKDDLDARFTEFGDQALSVVELYAALQGRHMAQFNEPLTLADFERVRKHPKVREIGLEQAYLETYKDRYAEVEATAKQQAEDAIRADERKKVIAELGPSGPPYPFAGQQPGNSPIDLLEGPDAKLQEAADGADPALLAQEYMQKVHETSPDDAGFVGA